MEVYRKLWLDKESSDRLLEFGEVKSANELRDVYSLRYQVYSKRGYIDPSKYPDQIEADEYDNLNKCKYFVAKYQGKIIGCIRLIVDDPLPTEKDFTFTEPGEMLKIPRDKRGELGRFVIISPNKEKGEFLPRGLVMLFLLDSLTTYGLNNGILGGYSFIKRSLEVKMQKLKIPFKRVLSFKQNYPSDGVLFKYFSQPEDPVIPIHFLTSDFKMYCEKHINNSKMFESIGNNEFILKQNLYVKFLKVLKII